MKPAYFIDPLRARPTFDALVGVIANDPKIKTKNYPLVELVNSPYVWGLTGSLEKMTQAKERMHSEQIVTHHVLQAAQTYGVDTGSIRQVVDSLMEERRSRRPPPPPPRPAVDDWMQTDEQGPPPPPRPRRQPGGAGPTPGSSSGSGGYGPPGPPPSPPAPPPPPIPPSATYNSEVFRPARGSPYDGRRQIRAAMPESGQGVNLVPEWLGLVGPPAPLGGGGGGPSPPPAPQVFDMTQGEMDWAEDDRQAPLLHELRSMQAQLQQSQSAMAAYQMNQRLEDVRRQQVSQQRAAETALMIRSELNARDDGARRERESLLVALRESLTSTHRRESAQFMEQLDAMASDLVAERDARLRAQDARTSDAELMATLMAQHEAAQRRTEESSVMLMSRARETLMEQFAEQATALDHYRHLAQTQAQDLAVATNTSDPTASMATVDTTGDTASTPVVQTGDPAATAGAYVLPERPTKRAKGTPSSRPTPSVAPPRPSSAPEGIKPIRLTGPKALKMLAKKSEGRFKGLSLWSPDMKKIIEAAAVAAAAGQRGRTALSKRSIVQPNPAFVKQRRAPTSQDIDDAARALDGIM